MTHNIALEPWETDAGFVLCCQARPTTATLEHQLRSQIVAQRRGDMSYDTILFSVDGGIARLTLNRPDKLNSFNTQMHGEVRHALSSLPASGARVLVLTGAGRGFCAGQDLGDRAVAPGSQGVDLGESIEKHYKPLVLALHTLPMPVIAAVNGVAAGAGANIALACDIVIAARSASFVQAFAKLGTASRFGRDLDAAAAGRQCARARPDLARQQAARGDRRRRGA